MTDSDRTVHAENDDLEVVRYDRAGKWFIEPKNRALMLPAQHITVREAIDTALWMKEHGGKIHFGQQGGGSFDRGARRA
jgi:hypothetical protein